LAALCVILGCEHEKSSSTQIPSPQKIDDIKTDTTNIPEVEKLTDLDFYLLDQGLVNVQDSAPDILVLLKYSTTDNFVGLDMYGGMRNCYLQPEVAGKLVKAQQKLKELNGALTLLVYDGVRPRSVQQMMWDTLKMPFERKIKFVSNPQFGSLHNFGAAVDITIANLEGSPLDMGAPYDDTSFVAWPIHELRYLQSGMLTQEQVDNRRLLRTVMTHGGFFNIQSEWWHFNACTREVAAARWKIVE